ncbi:hypothetical protein KZZ52_28370 [Dactylosporangium sp. AC04546]|uniref:hypothetical protein n=1 Tax=Dactylosporangium sp. AC04546 TaxID=2862460 RepID=UPI001EDE6E52|nr:hypothetical protein [Dactylosporangium sp. AC04546]WVK89185.1 hypothetical protein KZZ52_28370 [Dactylosporangium sp. AC04546]
MWTGGSAEKLTPEQMAQWHRRMAPPENELPAGVGLSVLLGRTGDAAVGITQVEAFSTGFRFTLAVRVRQARPQLARGRLFMLVSSHVHPGTEIPLDDRLLLGIEYPDGRRASSLHDMRMSGPAAEADGTQLVLVQQGGGGSDQSVDQTYWVAPLPPDGPITVVLAWPGFGMPESRTVLDGGAIHAAAARSQPLWPPQPVTQPAEPPPPPRPSSGWFAQPPS